jgi:hypothetical protein
MAACSVRNRMTSEMTPTTMTPEEFAVAIRLDQEGWRKVVQERNVFVE